MAIDSTYLVFEVGGDLLGEVEIPAEVVGKARHQYARGRLGIGEDVEVFAASKAGYDRQQARLERLELDRGRVVIRAFHEAGHAVVATPFPGVDYVSIRPRACSSGGGFDPHHDSTGFCRVRTWTDDGASAYQDRDLGERLAVYAMAGPMAEARVVGRKNWRRPGARFVSKTDRAPFESMVLCHCRAPGEPEVKDAYAAYLMARAAAEVDRSWPAITALAKLLADRLDLQGDEVEQVIYSTTIYSAPV